MRDFQRAVLKNGSPATIAIIVLSCAVFLFTFIAPQTNVSQYLSFNPAGFGIRPWTILTYPYAADIMQTAFLVVFFETMWMYSFGTTVEREIGTSRFIWLWIAMTLLPGLIMYGAMFALKIDAPLTFLYLPLSAITVVWATRHPNEQVRLMMVLPVAGKWIGWITAGFVLFDYGRGFPLLGVFACIHLIAAWAYAMNYIPGLAYGKAVFARKREGWTPREKNTDYFQDVKKREQERADRERLRKLLEGSISDDPEDKR